MLTRRAALGTNRTVAAPVSSSAVHGQWQGLSTRTGGTQVFRRAGDDTAYQLSDAVAIPGAVHPHPVLRLVPGTSQVSLAQRSPLTPPPGVFVYRNGWPQIDVDAVARGPGYVEPANMNLDFTYNDNGVTRLASDSTTFKVVAIYEPDCAGCTVELGTFLQEAVILARNNVQVFLITSAPEDRVRASLRGLPYPNLITVVSDYKQSLYASLHVKILPAQYFINGSVVKLVHLGGLGAEELNLLLNASGKKVGSVSQRSSGP